MRAIIQRVVRGGVTVGGDAVGSIERGLVVLVGVQEGDTDKDAQWLARRILGLRLWHNDDNGKPWAKNVRDLGYELLLVSQFTLFAVPKGNKPDFHHAMGGPAAREFFDSFVELVRTSYAPDKVQTGAFGQHMEVSLVNDGPVTIPLDSLNPKSVPYPHTDADTQ
eukprot:TRINITY_DN12080_c0_g1_i1.p1 TRINITY_DN12080_c0_g1~~TRINITY_DN12080_c0_g1_i1.p1  ORF type:complete len:165 (+),score=46.10 TRINITY_DN12080_c0_g1_i1:328-822(+)